MWILSVFVIAPLLLATVAIAVALAAFRLVRHLASGDGGLRGDDFAARGCPRSSCCRGSSAGSKYTTVADASEESALLAIALGDDELGFDELGRIGGDLELSDGSANGA